MTRDTHLEAELMRAVAEASKRWTDPDTGRCHHCGGSPGYDTVSCFVCELRDAYEAVVEDRQRVPDRGTE